VGREQTLTIHERGDNHLEGQREIEGEGGEEGTKEIKSVVRANYGKGRGNGKTMQKSYKPKDGGKKQKRTIGCDKGGGEERTEEGPKTRSPLCETVDAAQNEKKKKKTLATGTCSTVKSGGNKTENI